MSSIGQWSLYAALSALAKVDNINPHFIITATGMGCLNETDHFLAQLINSDNEMYSPTSFIQSTHNTIGGLIAMILKNNHYNITFSNRNASFENALIEAHLCNSNNMLVGSFEEISPFSMHAIERLHPINMSINDSASLYNTDQNGMLIGEGSTFFCLSNSKKENTTAIIDDISIVNSSEDVIELDNEIKTCITKLNESHHYDSVIMGYNGIKSYDKWYKYIAKMHFTHVPILKYKHLVGESFTASSQALWLANQLFSAPDLIDSLIPDKKVRPLNEILIYNYFMNTHCFISIKKQ